uniref:Uncharacterized protein n=1 Tax=Anopheles farauti TaxID=69004 RepID=A0A182QDA2_9DIPT
MVDMNCHGAGGILHALSVRGYFNGERYSWFLFGMRALEENRELLQRLNFTVSSNVHLLLPNGTDVEANYTIHEAYGHWRAQSWQLCILPIGSWNGTSGLKIWDKRSLYQRRMNLSETELSGVSEHFFVSGTEESLKNETSEAFSYGTRLWDVFMKVHKFSIKQGDMPVGTESFDFIVDAVEIKQENINSFDYTAAVGSAQSVLLFLHPDVDSTRNPFLRPFSTCTWLAIAALFLVFGLFLCKLLPFERELERNRPQPEELRRNENGVWVLVVGIFCQQGFIEKTNTYASRITLFTMFVFTVLIYQFYLTHIVSFLLVVPPKTIKTLKQLAANDYGLAVENVPETIEFLNTTEDEYLAVLLEKQLASAGNVYYDAADGIALMASGKNAFLCDAQRAYKLIRALYTDEQRCALQEIPLMPKTPVHLAMAKGSPMTELFRITAQRIIEYSMVEYERKQCYTDQPRCADNEVKMPEVNLDQVSSVLVMQLAAIIVSVVILLVEIGVQMVSARRH